MTVTALHFIASHIDWLAHRPEAEEAFDELDNANAIVRIAIDTAPVMAYLGPCEVCGRDMYAPVGKLEVECRPCALIYTVANRREWLLEQAEDRLERAVEVSRALTGWGFDITRHRLKMWEVRGRLVAKAHDAAGRPLYRIGDVVEVARQDAMKRADTA